MNDKSKKDFYKIYKQIHKEKRELRKKLLGLDDKKESVHMRIYGEATKTKRAIKTQLFGNKGKDANTSIEIFVRDFLDENNINYIQQFAVRYANYDFYLPEQNVLLECEGDYFHCNPLLYDKPKNLLQERNLDKNKMKMEIAESKNIPLVRIWEYAIKKQPDVVKTSLKKYIEEFSGSCYNVVEINYKEAK